MYNIIIIIRLCSLNEITSPQSFRKVKFVKLTRANTYVHCGTRS